MRAQEISKIGGALSWRDFDEDDADWISDVLSGRRGTTFNRVSIRYDNGQLCTFRRREQPAKPSVPPETGA